jgi:hypothetical protein
MKKTVIFFIALFSVIIGMFGCDGDDEKATSHYLGDTVILKIGESISFAEESANRQNDLIICFKEVLEDNRIPLDICHLSYGSHALIEVSMQYQNKTYNIPFQIGGCNQDSKGNLIDVDVYQDTIGYSIRVYSLDPYPGELPMPENSINPTDYKIKLKVEKL